MHSILQLRIDTLHEYLQVELVRNQNPQQQGGSHAHLCLSYVRALQRRRILCSLLHSVGSWSQRQLQVQRIEQSCWAPLEGYRCEGMPV